MTIDNNDRYVIGDRWKKGEIKTRSVKTIITRSWIERQKSEQRAWKGGRPVGEAHKHMGHRVISITQRISQ